MLFVFFDLALLALASILMLASAARIATRLYPERPWSRVLATGVLTIGEIVVASEVLGTIGMYRPVPMLLVTLGGAVTVSLVLRATGSATTGSAVTPIRWPLGRGLSFALIAFALGTLAVTLGRPSTGLDTLQYHWPLAAHWVNAGNLTTPTTFAIGNYAWYYPSNINLVQSWTVLFTGRDMFLPWVGWVFFGFAIAATAGLVRRLGGRIGTGALAGLAFVTVPVVIESQLRSGQVDLATAGLFAAAAFFFVAFLGGPVGKRQRIDAALGGLALGLAAGSKLIALPYAGAIGLGFAIIVIIAARRGRLPGREAFLGLVYAGGLAAMTGGYFFLRNFLTVGNPLFPSPFLGARGAWFPFDVDALNFTVSDYFLARNFHPWIVGGWTLVMWVGGLLAIAALVIVPVLAWRDRREGHEGHIEQASTLWLGCWGLPLLTGVVYAFTPTSAGGPWGFPGLFVPNLRYALPFILFAFCGLAAALDRRFRNGTTWLFRIIVAVNLGHLCLLAIGVLGQSGGELAATTALVGLAAGLAATACGAGVVYLMRRFILNQMSEQRRSRVTFVIGVGTLTVALSAALATGWFFTYDNRFGFVTDDYAIAYDVVRSREAQDPDRPQRIAYTAFVHNFPLLGSRLQNDVFLAAGRAPGPGFVARPFSNATEFLQVMCDRQPDLLVSRSASPVSNLDSLNVSTDDEALIKRAVNYEGLLPHEVEWARAHPDVFQEIAAKGETVVFDVNGPAACAAVGK